MSNRKKPQYISQAYIARHLEVSPTSVTNWLARWPADDPVLPTPEPDAFVDGRSLWLQESLYKWEAWRKRHMEMWGGRMQGNESAGRPPVKRKAYVPRKVVVGIDESEAEENLAALRRMFRDLHAKSGWILPLELAHRSGLSYSAVLTALKMERLPERQTVIDLTKALGGDPDVAADLWTRSRPARRIDGGWFSRVLSVPHRKVLELAANGNSVKTTAEKLGWTVEGVRDYWGDITERLRVQSMDEAVAFAVASNLLVTNADGSIMLTPQKGGRGAETLGGEHGHLLYKIAHDLRTKLADADPGTPVGTIDKLRVDYQTSATTILATLKMLKAEGVIAGGGKGHPYIVADR